MTGFDFATSTDSSTTSTTNDDSEVSPDFEANETADLYLSFGDWANNLAQMLDSMDLEELKVYSDDTLEDAPRLLGEHSDAHPQQHLHMVAVLAKSTAGKIQLDENDHAIGLVDGSAPESHDEVQQDFSYALFANDLPTINWEGLDGGERENLEEMGIDPTELGFDPAFGGPKLMKINGERLPIAAEEGNEPTEALELLNEIPNTPSTYTEDGFQESSDPSVFGESEETDDTDNGGSSDISDIASELASDPSAVSNFNVDEVKKAVTHITSRRTLRRILEAEQNDEDRSDTDRIEQRIRAVEGNDDEDDTEAESEASDESDDESGEAVESESNELSDADKTLIASLLNSGEAENYEEAKQMVV